MMIVLLYFDWFETAEELSEIEDKMAAICAKKEGVEYRGRYSPDNRKFHFVYMFEAENYEKILEILTDPEMPPRDYKVLFVSDANATSDQESHRSTLRTISRGFGEVVSTADLLKRFQ